MLIPSTINGKAEDSASLSRRVNANSQRARPRMCATTKLIKKGEC